MKNLNQVVDALKQGNVIAYPTEGVFGVGCDPDNEQALLNLLDVKKRPKEKGLILIAASIEQLLPYIDLEQLTEEQVNTIKASWPGPVTWIVPVKTSTLPLVTGQFDSIAVRVTAHPQVKAICNAFGKPITSTSANLSGLEPCRSATEVEAQLGDTGVVIFQGEVGNRTQPTEIRDAKTGNTLRQG
ncbi:tRNA threonylcarbamoyladenosine biosynthesis protein RimN [Aliivibrio fischeri]|uniref:Sua5/YciO/YrdC/YwlC family protein n=1 Tax=Aliivibrio fischeri TaxID=668 RepID=UPI0007C4A5A6|nr:Sua5/YciO/YrdC/YwlC family protein [Aliivibrio fischeri]TDM55858.1 tRNA threonylcarbamoyladenosine biosynthesis protein RimN [Aliivibrio fischeri]TGA73134.1 tRNA threonylcarbamoyladenosine biosynthesis protein RimN [Aliivibrio fischeri]